MNLASSQEAKSRKLATSLKIFGIANCLLGLVVLVYVILMYFATERAIQNEANITTENYDYMLQAFRLAMLVFVPGLGVLAILTGVHSLNYLHSRRKIEQQKSNDA
jgi:uncharacterized membrane protein